MALVHHRFGQYPVHTIIKPYLLVQPKIIQLELVGFTSAFNSVFKQVFACLLSVGDAGIVG